MSTHTSTCVRVLCDGPACDGDKGWPDEGPFHFDSEQAAVAYELGEGEWAGHDFRTDAYCAAAAPSRLTAPPPAINGRALTSRPSIDPLPAQQLDLFHTGAVS